jgi:hypothetical protein
MEYGDIVADDIYPIYFVLDVYVLYCWKLLDKLCESDKFSINLKDHDKNIEDLSNIMVLAVPRLCLPTLTHNSPILSKMTRHFPQNYLPPVF